MPEAIHSARNRAPQRPDFGLIDKLRAYALQEEGLDTLDANVALGLPAVFGGAIITEQVFRVNGLGQLLISAIQANDIPMVLTLTFIFAILIVVFTLIADLLYGILDPRIRYD